MAELIEMPFG